MNSAKLKVNKDFIYDNIQQLMCVTQNTIFVQLIFALSCLNEISLLLGEIEYATVIPL